MGAILQTVWGVVVALCGALIGSTAYNVATTTPPDPVLMVVPCEHPPPAALPELNLGEPVLPGK